MAINSVTDSRLGINMVLTNLAQGQVNTEYKLRLLFPLAEVSAYGGQIIEFDNSAFNEYDDDRADDAPYKEIQESYGGRPFTLETKGLSYRVGDKVRTQMDNLRINWAARAPQSLMNAGGLKHEIQAANLATDVSKYASTNRVTLTSGGQLNDSATDPGSIIRSGKRQVGVTCGKDANVWVMGKEVFDVLVEKSQIKEQIKYTSMESVTEELLAAIYGFDRVAVIDAQKNTSSGGRSRVFGKDMVFAYVNPAALNADRIPYRLTDTINVVTPSFGYTYVMKGHPFVYNPYYDDARGAQVFKMDFDRAVVMTGVDKTSGLSTSGYLVKNAIA